MNGMDKSKTLRRFAQLHTSNVEKYGGLILASTSGTNKTAVDLTSNDPSSYSKYLVTRHVSSHRLPAPKEIRHSISISKNTGIDRVSSSLNSALSVPNA